MADEEETTVVKAFPLELLDVGTDEREAYLVVISGNQVGRLVRVVNGTMTMGRSDGCDILIKDDGVSRVHCEIRTRRGRSEIWDRDSTNGTYVESQRVRGGPRRLEDGERIRLGPATMLKFGHRDTLEQRFLDRLYQSATRDALTGAFNRSYFEEHLETELSWHLRHKEPMSLLMVDVDHFKLVNDRHGHPAGDKVLREVAERMSRMVRAKDIVARLGGEEFAILLRKTELMGARAIAERIRAAVGDLSVIYRGEHISCTISIGVACRVDDEEWTPERLIAESDRLLYVAKDRGRNRVCAG